MLSDPTIVNVITASEPTYAVGANHTFRKISNGKMICTDGYMSDDQPGFLSVRQKARKIQANAFTPVEFTTRHEQHFNVPAVNGIAQSDVPLIVELRVISVPSVHTVVSLQYALNACTGFTQSHLARLRAGEGI